MSEFEYSSTSAPDGLYKDDPKATPSAAVTEGLEQNFDGKKYDEAYRRTGQVDSFIEELKSSSIERGIPHFLVASATEDLWMEVRAEYGAALPVPLVALGADGGVMFTWEKGPHYLEVEIDPGSCEAFYLNRETDSSQDIDIPASFLVLQSIKEWLTVLAAA